MEAPIVRRRYGLSLLALAGKADQPRIVTVAPTYIHCSPLDGATCKPPRPELLGRPRGPTAALRRANRAADLIRITSHAFAPVTSETPVLQPLLARARE